VAITPATASVARCLSHRVAATRRESCKLGTAATRLLWLKLLDKQEPHQKAALHSLVTFCKHATRQLQRSQLAHPYQPQQASFRSNTLSRVMHFRTSLIFPLLSTLSYAPQATPVTSTDKRTGCFTSDSVFNFIPSRIEREPDFNFGIRTSYTTYYPKTLKLALAADGFKHYVLSPYESCGWNEVRSAHKVGHRGNVY
jgi:hypothetical protein